MVLRPEVDLISMTKEQRKTIGRKRKAPDAKTYVTLAEALTWLAFKYAMTAEELRELVEQQSASGGTASRFFRDRESGLERLDEAWLRLRDGVDSGVIRIRGRYTRQYSMDEVLRTTSRPLSGARLQSFSQFDISTGGVRRQLLGTPAVLWVEHESSFDREFERFAESDLSAEYKRPAAEGYLIMEVEREGLMRLRSSRSSPYKVARAPDDQKVLEKCDEMKERGLTTREIAKQINGELGFEHVSHVQARNLMTGRYPRTGRPKKKI